MSRTAIVVRTANRPEILNRCLAAAVEGCDVARHAYWLVLDDSSAHNLSPTREVAKFWMGSGLRLAYVDQSVEAEIADGLPGANVRASFRHLVARSPSCRTEGGRNLGLIAGLSLSPDVLLFVDDDMVHRHEGNCFFHWCSNNTRSGSFIASPRKLGITDMSYLNRLNNLLNRDDWARFFSDTGISSDPDLWYSPNNPLWKNGNGSDPASLTLAEREVVSGQFIALGNNGAEWLPFPDEYNSDLNWSLLQSCCFATPLLKVGGVNVKHLPPRLGCPQAESILSEFIGTAIARALRRIKQKGEQSMNRLADRLPDFIGLELKQELFLFLNVERVIRSRVRTSGDGIHAGRTLLKVQRTLADVGERLSSLDSRQLATSWLDDFAARNRMLQELRRDEAVQTQIRRVLFGTSS